MNILLLSAYDTASHRYWCDGLMAQFAEHQWCRLSLPPRYFSWRVRGNSLTWAGEQKERLEQPYDLVVATSMTDLNGLRGFIPQLARSPSILYFHENQFAYPPSALQHSVLEAQIVSLYSALCSQRILFNSRYNQDSFFLGVSQLLKKLPDGIPPGIVQQLQARSGVLPVPLMPISKSPQRENQPQGQLNSNEFHVVWNHRWEYDKGPERLMRLIERVPEAWSVRWHIVGQQFRQQPKEFAAIHQLLIQRGSLGAWGYLPARSDYFDLLSQCDLVLSTASHDFQGLSIQEAVCAGCIPLVPNDLAYPEWFAEPFLYSVQDSEDLFERFSARYRQKCTNSLPSPPDLTSLTWSKLREEYTRAMFEIRGEPER